MDTFFTVKNEDLERLNPKEAVELFRELLWAEARSIGLPITNVNVSDMINIPDGGVDASFEGLSPEKITELLKYPKTIFQIKAASSFVPWQDSVIKSELFGTKEATKENLKSEIRERLDNGNAYILVCFKNDLTDQQHSQAKKNIEKYFKVCGYVSTSIEVLSQNMLRGIFQKYPSLALKVNQKERARFQTYDSWSQNDDMTKEFIRIEEHESGFLTLQNSLRNATEALHVRVLGEPGIGKTKFVLESASDENLRALIIYCNAETFRDSELMNEILRDDNNYSVILVLDECDLECSSYIWNRLKNRGERIKLVSIYSDYELHAQDIRYVEMPPLNQDAIAKIIQSYNIPKDKARNYANFCGGSPRVAHIVGLNLQKNPEDLLKEPGTVRVWDRFIAGYDDIDGEQVRQKLVVLRFIALFKRFGFHSSMINEAKAISEMVNKADKNISWLRFQEIVKELRTNKILQGEYTLYISPKLLQIKLWSDWWNSYGTSFEINNFFEQLTPKLIEWFFEMFKYAFGSNNASQIVDEMLKEDGSFSDQQLLDTPRGSKFFLALAEANPKSALRLLKKSIGTWDKERLKAFVEGRRNILWALEKIAVHKDLFQDASRILLSLAEAENETWSNNATGIFTKLFVFGPGAWAATQSTPEERFEILKEALDSSSKEKVAIGLNACNASMEAHHFTRMVGAERQGLKEIDLWTPKTYGELWNAYRQAWQFIRERLDNLPEDLQKEGVKILLGRARGLAVIKSLENMVFETLTQLSQKPYVNKKEIISAIIQIVKYENKVLPKEIIMKWDALKDEIIGNDFHSLLKRYVGMRFLEDSFDENRNHVDQSQPKIEELANKVINDFSLLAPELSWLTTEEAENGYQFGYELGKRDLDFNLLPMLLNALRVSKSKNVFFIGGYFRSIFERDSLKWETQLDLLSDDVELNVVVPEITFRSGMSDKAAERILKLAEKNIIDAGYFAMFIFGSVIKNLSEDIFLGWIKYLMESQQSNAIFIALNLHDFYYLGKESKHNLPETITYLLLTHASLLKIPEGSRANNQMDEYHWNEIAKKYFDLYPEKAMRLADFILDHFEEEGTIFRGLYSSTKQVLWLITQKFPKYVWGIIIKYLGPPIDTRGFHIREWLRGSGFPPVQEPGALELIPVDEIWKWVDENIKERAWYVAHLVPNKFFHSEEKICLAREVIIRYGHIDDVMKELFSNFSSEGWTGPASLHYKNKKEWLLRMINEEQNEKVKQWLDEYISITDNNIERERISEEREDY